MTTDAKATADEKGCGRKMMTIIIIAKDGKPASW